MSKVTMPEPALSQVRFKGFACGWLPWMGWEWRNSMGGEKQVRHLATTEQADTYADTKVRKALEWQPIETAPRGGTWVRLWREPETIGNASPEIIAVYNALTEYMSDGVWMWPTDMYDPYTERGRLLALDKIKNGDFYEDGSFTHWMPLPPRPQHDNQ
uniref:hypothetical protein n=1 Tax=Alcaligenes faecalis TaxID=511 RepID=UPI003D049639